PHGQAGTRPARRAGQIRTAHPPVDGQADRAGAGRLSALPPGAVQSAPEGRVRLYTAKDLGRGLRLFRRPPRGRPALMLPWIWLGACILISSTVEAVTGFGSIVIALSLGALLLPIASMLPVLVPLNIFMTGTIAWKNRRHIDRALL